MSLYDKVEQAQKLVRTMTNAEKEEFKKWCEDWDFHIVEE